MRRDQQGSLILSPGESECLLHPDAPAVVEEENIDTHQPAAHGPDGIAGGGFGQRFQDGAESQQCGVYQNG